MSYSDGELEYVRKILFSALRLVKNDAITLSTSKLSSKVMRHFSALYQGGTLFLVFVGINLSAAKDGMKCFSVRYTNSSTAACWEYMTRGFFLLEKWG